jgi:ferrochelatase
MKKAVLLMAHGTPRSESDIKEFYTSIRKGKEPTETELNTLKNRYNLIGGLSPLNSITVSQKNKIADLLGKHDITVALGFKHIRPLINESIAELAKTCDEILGLVLSPYWSQSGNAGYVKTFEDSCRNYGIKCDVIKEFWNRDFLSVHYKNEITKYAEIIRDKFLAVFSTHSVPLIDAFCKSYFYQHKTLAGKIAAESGISDFTYCFQSRGLSNGDWLEPNLLDLLSKSVHKNYKNVLVFPVGFVTDNLEILYDLDIDFSLTAKNKGFNYFRTALPNDSDDFCKGLSEMILEHFNA